MRQLLKYDEKKYEGVKASIMEHANLLVEASLEIERLGLPFIKPEHLLDGKFVNRVIAFHEKDWRNNIAFKKIRFEKYLEFIELDCSSLEKLQTKFVQGQNRTLSFYPFNHIFYSYFEHRPEGKDILSEAGRKVTHRISDLYSFRNGEIQIHLDEEYFKLYATKASQMEKIKDVEMFVHASKKIGAEYRIVKSVIGHFVRNLSSDLSSIEMNYPYILSRV